MSRAVKQPIGQKRLTNIAVVRFRKQGKRFEVACYKNKIANWRAGIETDLDEVLQTTAVFANVSRGVLAKAEDLQAVFGTTDEAAVCLRILKEGDMQVSDKERELEYSTLFKDVVLGVASRCVNPATRRPYTASMLERALKGAGFAVDPKRGAKQQALEAIQVLKERIPIERAKMRLKLTAPAAAAPDLAATLAAHGAVLEGRDLSLDGATVTIVCLVEPGAFRGVHAATAASGGGVAVEVLAVAAIDAAGVGGADGGDEVDHHDGASEDETVAGVATGLRSLRAPTSSDDDDADAGAAAPPPARRHATPPAPSAPPAPTYPRGPVAGLPPDLGPRVALFAELDSLQPGWSVELTPRAGGGEGGAVDAVFYSPDGTRVGAFAAARRLALAASRAAKARGGECGG